jgi:hypothetical protein
MVEPYVPKHVQCEVGGWGHGRGGTCEGLVLLVVCGCRLGLMNTSHPTLLEPTRQLYRDPRSWRSIRQGWNHCRVYSPVPASR